MIIREGKRDFSHSLSAPTYLCLRAENSSMKYAATMKYCLNRFARFGSISGLIFYIAPLLCSINAFASESIPFEYKVEYCESAVQISEIEAAIDCKYNSEYFPTRAGIRESDRWIRVHVQSNPNTKSEQSVAIRVAPYLLKDIAFFNEQVRDGNQKKQECALKETPLLATSVVIYLLQNHRPITRILTT